MSSRDVFICHASADKEALARPLADALGVLGVSCWVDEGVLRLGDSLVKGINTGLAQASTVLLLITRNFIGRSWTEREMAAALSLQLAGMTRLIPVIDVPRAELAKTYPLLLDTISASVDLGVEQIARDISEQFGRRSAKDWVFLHEKTYVGPIWTRVTPAVGSLEADHEVCIRWGDWIYRTAIEDLNAPISLTHFKERADEHRMFVEVTPDAIVTVGQGVAPDRLARDINEGWSRPVGFGSKPEKRYAAKAEIENSAERVRWRKRLKAEYILTHDDLPEGFEDSEQAPPTAWLRRRCLELGISDLMGFE